jgi:phospholipid-translocating ATPase
MLTGDKIETAKCIATSSGLKALKMQFFTIKDTTDDLLLNQKLNEYNLVNDKAILVIDGVSLNTALSEGNKQYFF